MDSTSIKSLDSDFLKSFEQFRIKNSQSPNSLNSSYTAEEEIENKHDVLTQQLKNLCFDNVPDSKDVSSICSTEVFRMRSGKETISDELIISEDEKKYENQLSFSSTQNKKILNNDEKIGSDKLFEDEDDSSKNETEEPATLIQHLKKLTFDDVSDSGILESKNLALKCSNENLEINDANIKPNQSYLFKKDSKRDESQYCIFPLNNNKVLNNNLRNCVAGYESDSDGNDQEESVTLRERYPNRHNRSENNKQFRTIPFPQNQSRSYKTHLQTNNFEKYGNNHAKLHNFSDSYDGNDPINTHNWRNFKRYDGVSQSCLSNFQSFTDEAFESPCDMVANQLASYTIPKTATDQIVDDAISYPGIDQIINGVVPYEITDETLDSVATSPSNNRNVNDKLVAEINGAQYFDNHNEIVFEESTHGYCSVTNGREETFSGCNLEDLDIEYVNCIIENLTETNKESFSSHHHVSLVENSSLCELSSTEVDILLNDDIKKNQNKSVGPIFEEIGNANKSNKYNLDLLPDHFHSFFSNTNVQRDNNIFENPDELHIYECVANTSGNYSNMVSKNTPLINKEHLSHDYIKISVEIEQEIAKLKEMEQRCTSQHYHDLTNSWSMLPFVELDSNSISECFNSSGYKSLKKKNGSYSKRINQIHNSTCKTEEQKIDTKWRTEARDALFRSSTFSKRLFDQECEMMRQQIENGELGTEERRIIHFLKKNRRTKYRGTNLHYAILSKKVEKVVCIVECHKECHNGTSEINLPDSPDKKTVLDYSKEKGLHLLTAYLEENNAKEGIRV